MFFSISFALVISHASIIIEDDLRSLFTGWRTEDFRYEIIDGRSCMIRTGVVYSNLACLHVWHIVE
jgi:hypothetical protein